MRAISRILISAFFLSLVLLAVPVFSQEKLTVYFFKTETCPHCLAEKKFLDEMEKKYPSLEILSYPINLRQNQDLLKKLAEEHNAERYIGVVPLTFIGEDFFVGFDNSDGMGHRIEASIQKQIGEQEVEAEETLWLPFAGNIDISKYSFSALAVFLGFLDGFNVCSLAALVLILGLVLVLKSRKKILLFGGTFVLTTAVVYGLLIILWHQLFSFFAPYIRTLEILVALLAVGGSAFFFRQFFLFKKYGPSCSATTGNSFVSRFFIKIQKVFENPNSTIVLLGSVFLFALAVAIIEFPCSAAIPVVFAGILAKSQLPFAAYLFYIGLFVLLYMLDELIIFLVAVFKMNIWLNSPKFTVWVTLIEAIFLALIGLYYLIGVI